MKISTISLRSAIVFQATIALLAFMGCKGGEERRQAVGEMRSIQTAIHGLDILASAGINQIEYSQRLGDVLLKVGDLEPKASAALMAFRREDQATVAEIYRHLGLALEAYKQAKDFFGDNHVGQLDPFGGDNLFGEQRYEALRNRLPNLDELHVAIDYSNIGDGRLGGKHYWKGDMLEALWKLASQEDTAAAALIDKIAASN
jgi:hypothetical protein